MSVHSLPARYPLICQHFFVVFSRCSQPREEVTLNFRLKFAQREREQQQEEGAGAGAGAGLGAEAGGKATATAAEAAVANNVAYFLGLAVWKWMLLLRLSLLTLATSAWPALDAVSLAELSTSAFHLHAHTRT